MMNRIYMVNAFTDKPFSGNPACICFLTEPATDQWMQEVAYEMRTSETAFLLEQADGFSLRWFTPQTEVDLCGHATLASAHILWETGRLEKSKEAKFFTKSGLVIANHVDDLIEMGFPILYHQPADFNPELLAAFNITPDYVGTFDQKLLMVVDGEEIVRNLNPDFNILRCFRERGIAITSAADSPDYDFISRYFAPWVGVDEDPVTGSSHCCLGPFWSKRMKKSELIAYQASPRGGSLRLKVDKQQVLIGGKAVTIYEGKLLI